MEAAKTERQERGGLILRGDTWHMRFTVKGVLVAESTHTSIKRDAEGILAVRKAELIQQLVLGQLKPVKLHTAINEFLRARQNMPSHKNAKMHLDRFRVIPDKLFNQVTDNELQNIIEDLFEQEYSKSTIGVSVNYFNALVNYCVEKGYTTRKKLKTIKGVKGKVRWMTDEEETKLFAAIDPKADYPGKNELSDSQRQDNYDLCKLLSHTAARRAEIADMLWGQVDLKAGTVLIKRGKGGRDSTLHMTRAMKEIFERRRKVHGGHYVFPTKKGVHNDTHWMQNAVERAGLSTKDGSVTLHTFRHSRAVKWLQAGLDVLEVQKMLGHTNIQSTMVYLHLVPGATEKKAAAAIDAVN